MFYFDAIKLAVRYVNMKCYYYEQCGGNCLEVRLKFGIRRNSAKG